MECSKAGGTPSKTEKARRIMNLEVCVGKKTFYTEQVKKNLWKLSLRTNIPNGL